MAKSDFLSWDKDLDLDLLLGDYTDYDENYDSDDDNFQKVTNTSKSKPVTSRNVFKCPVCEKELKTISGFRGHVRKQHDLNVKATDYKINENATKQNNSSVFDENNFPVAFAPALKRTLVNVKHDPFVDDKDEIMKCVDIVQSSTEIQDKLCTLFMPVFINHDSDISISADREQIFRRLHKQRNDSDVMETVRNLLPGVTVETMRLFIQLIFEDIVGELLTEQLKIGKTCSQKNHEAITENDQSILYYIAGYIVRSLKKKYHRCPNISYVNDLTNASGGHSFVSKYDKWYTIQSRGGLQKPSDDFFLLVRELETVVRKNTKTNLDATALLVNPLKECMMESFMVKHYCKKLSETLPTEVVEDILQIFLTIRGFAVVRVERNKMAKSAKTDSRKSAGLRQTLRDLRRI